jgi:hypothetical protein
MGYTPMKAPPGAPDAVRSALGHRVGPLIPAWVARAACGGMGRREGDPFFPQLPAGAQNQHTMDKIWAAAKAVCASCPVLLECKEEYWNVPSLNTGMWYGMTPPQREAYRHNRRRWRKRKNANTTMES